jgi:DNA-directed RNA polymerase sigma subunit (sigma70/sigma32)
MDVQIETIPQLRKLFPLLRGLNNKDLKDLIIHLQTVDLESLQQSFSRDKRLGPKLEKRKIQIEYETVLAMRQGGKSLKAIADVAGVSSERIRQILAENSVNC